jgi:hypothetical protein
VHPTLTAEEAARVTAHEGECEALEKLFAL